MEIRFTLPIRPVTKKNSGRIIMRGKYPILLPSEQYVQFEKESLPFFNQVKNQIGVIHYPVNVKCVFYTDARRKVDLCNLLNAVDDAMVASGLVIDDNRDIVAAHDGSRVYCDRLNPRIEITIEELKSYEQYEQWKDTENVQRSLKL